MVTSLGMYSGYTTPVAYIPWKASIEDILNDEIVSSDKDILRTYFTSQSQEPKNSDLNIAKKSFLDSDIWKSSLTLPTRKRNIQIVPK